MAESRRTHVQTPVDKGALSDRAQALQRRVQDVLTEVQPQPAEVLDTPGILVKPQDIVDACRILKEEPSLSFRLLLCLAGVDYKDYIQIVYVLLSLEHEHKLLIKTNVLYDDLHLPTVTSVWKAAEWYEREAHDLFGVVFDGHPDLAPLILYEGFEGYPGRKDHPFHDYQEF